MRTDTADNMPPVGLGIDVGSKTVKFAAIDENGGIVFAEYHRHRSDVLTTLADLLHEAIWKHGDMNLPIAMTGSAGIALAETLGIPFVQEVVATSNAVRARYPDADCVIELGGEDAKITYLTGNVEQRMNATCAGGTGDFIDGIAHMLGVRTRDMSKLALGSQRTYPIASRCAVFAQTDVRPLVNAGIPKSDIAQSALDAVVRQTLGGLACGRPISGKVVFLGGPLEHIPALVMLFRRKLGLSRETGIKPADAHLFAAIGAILTAAESPSIALSDLERLLRSEPHIADGSSHLPPLFESEDDLRSFRERHARKRIERRCLDEVDGPLFLGFDAGSTSLKYALVDGSGALVASDYRDVKGDALKTAAAMLEELLLRLDGGPYSRKGNSIAHATVTGYGEDLLIAGFGFDSGIVETVAHVRAAHHFRPDASFVLDIGGQDMKALWIRDGMVVDAVLNEACSSGCGAFIQSSARSLRLGYDEFSKLAMGAQHPVDLGAKCTVFMTSRVRHAQKSGAPKGDIAAGIAYSIVNNVITRIIGKSHALPLGDAVIVQGGTFKSDAVLRAFEKLTGIEALRPDAAHLMGAYGAALVARDRWQRVVEGQRGSSSILGIDEMRSLNPKKLARICPGCGNSCTVSVVDFGNGRRFISGNRCERAAAALFGEKTPNRAVAPNVASLEQDLIAKFGDVVAGGRRGGVTVGIMNAMNGYENMPFWHTLFSQLGFSVMVPDDDRARPLADSAAETVPSESACHPAKLSHLRYAYLADRGADYVFMPSFERGTRCPVSCEYVFALADNVGTGRIVAPSLRAIRARALARSDDDLASLRMAIESMLPPGDALSHDEFESSLHRALKAQEDFEESVRNGAMRAFEWLREDPSRRAAVIAGRPYHIDPAVIHRIDCELSRLGFAAVPMLGLSEDLGNVSSAKPLWKPAKHLTRLVEAAARNDQIEVVALRSFGCLYDAVSFDEARDLAFGLHRPFTELKIDDIADTAHIRIRLRTLAHASQVRQHGDAENVIRAYGGREKVHAPTPDLCSTAKSIVDMAIAALGTDPACSRIEVPFACKDCLTDALPYEIKHLLSVEPLIEVVENEPAPESTDDGRPVVGFLGNPRIVFDPELNDHSANLVERLGWRVAYPDPKLLEIEDVRYIDQLEAFHAAGVKRVIYLQSSGCLKGHVRSRGALHELQRLFPDMPITVIDFDPESSPLNRENRIRLALALPVLPNPE